MKSYFLCSLAVLFAIGAHGQEFTAATAARGQFLDTALSRLAGKARPDQFQFVREKAEIWKKTRTETDWNQVSEAVYMAAKASDSKSDVTIATSSGNGASVKYQTLGQRKRNEPPTTAKGLTVAVESMYIGMYHIWSERSGSPTSNRDDQFDITGPAEKVTLQEYK
jgi:hypothetical protein